MSVLFSSSFSLHPLNTSIFAAHGPFAWHDGAGLHPLKEKQKAAFISELHYLTPPLQSLTSPNHCLSLCFPPSPSPPSPSIRQIWRSLWSMCSRGTSKRFQGSWIKAWTQTSTIQTQEVWECAGLLSGCHSPRFQRKMILDLLKWAICVLARPGLRVLLISSSLCK